MYTTSRDLKARARGIMRQRLMALMLTAAVYLIADYLISFFADELSGVNAWNRELIRRLGTYASQIQSITDYAEMEELMSELIFSMPRAMTFARGFFAIALSWIISLMSVPLAAGYTFHIIQESRGVKTRVSSLMAGFRLTFKTIWLNILTSLIVALGLMLFFVPGIILIYRYSLAVYLLMDDPEKGAVACMKESGRLMKGNKWRLFKLGFSFFGWLLLSSIVTSLVNAPILNVWLTPYMTMAQAVFYNELVGPERFRVEEFDDGPEM